MLKLYNSLSREKEEFIPINEGKVGFYHCGPTVYWTQHIGNLRGMTCGDIIVRTLRYLGYEVTHVRNYTDVGHLTSDSDQGEDKITKGVRREGLNPSQLSQKYIDIFENDTSAINLLEPTIKPKATEHIHDMINMVRTLLEKGYAYTTDLAVYFDVSKAKDYNALNRQKLEELDEGAGKGDVSDPAKKHHADFALWFFKAGVHKNALQYWTSPFHSPLVEHGEGFPGWHIECSAMSKKYLGDTLDIHMGGIEHIPIHHTNEIAQSESANGARFVNYWMHNAHLVVDNEKMAKSQGTSFSLSEITEKGFSPIVLRYFYLQAQYRSAQNFTWDALQAAQNGLDNIYNVVESLGKEMGDVDKRFKDKFIKALSDDFNTPVALSIFLDMLKSKISNQDKLATALDFDKVLGLKLDDIINAAPISIPGEIQKIVDERSAARKDKDFKKSDELRDLLKEKGYSVADTKDGQQVKKI